MVHPPRMKLYHYPKTRSSRVLWLLGELGIEPEIVLVDAFERGGRGPQYRAIHPHGVVPALEHDGDVMLESIAICLWLADRYADRQLAPPLNSPLRARYCQWMVYVAATCDPAIEMVWLHTRFLPEERRNPALLEPARKAWATCEQVLSSGLGDGRWMLGDEFSAADIAVGSVLAWARLLTHLKINPNLSGYLSRCLARPAFQRAYNP